MSMFVLNATLSERHPTVSDGLIYTYPFDGEMHCCIVNKRYARVLVIDCGSNYFYNYFQEKASIITLVSMDSNLGNIQAVKGQYNLIAIDGKDIIFTKEVLEKIATLSRETKTSIIINSANDEKIIYNYGGSSTCVKKIIKEKHINGAITTSSLYTSLYNTSINEDGLCINNGYIKIPWDNRINGFTISTNIDIGDSEKNIVGIACIASDVQLLGILYNKYTNKIIIEDGNIEAKYVESKEVMISQESLIVISNNNGLISVYIDGQLYCSANIQSSTKGNELIIGNNTLTSKENMSNIYISRLSIYEKPLNIEDINILSKGRLIFT